MAINKVGNDRLDIEKHENILTLSFKHINKGCEDYRMGIPLDSLSEMIEIFTEAKRLFFGEPKTNFVAPPQTFVRVDPLKNPYGGGTL